MKEKKVSNYIYQFANGEKIVVNLNIHFEGDYDWGQLLKELDRMEYNNNQTERRRHCSLENYNKNEHLTSGEVDLLEKCLMRERWDALLENLTVREREVLDLFFCQGYTALETANLLGVGRTRVTNLVASIRSKMKKSNKNLN